LRANLDPIIIKELWWILIKLPSKYSIVAWYLYYAKIWKEVTIVNWLPKWSLSGTIWKIRDSFSSAAGSLVFNGSFNFPLQINLMEHDRSSSHSTMQIVLFCVRYYLASLGERTLIWSNRWTNLSLE